MYRIGFIIVITLAVALGTVIGTLNSATVSVDLLWVQIEWPLGLLILSILFVGLLLGLGLAWFFGIVPLRVRLRKARSKEQSVSSGALKT